MYLYRILQLCVHRCRTWLNFSTYIRMWYLTGFCNMDFSRSKEFILPAIILKLLQHPIIHRLVLSRIDTSHAYWCTIAVRFQHLGNIWATFRPHRLGSLWQGRTSKKNPVHSKPRLEIYGNPRGGAARAPCIDFLPVIGTVPPYDFLNLYGVFVNLATKI